MKIKNFVLSLVLFSSSLFPQINWEQQTLPQGTGILLTIDISENEIGFSGGWTLDTSAVVGSAVHTINGGINWNNSTFPDSTRGFIYSRLFDNSNGIAAATYNLDTSSTFNFKEYYYQLNRSKNYREFELAKLGYAKQIPTGVMILRTTNGGADWQTVSALPDSFDYIYSGYFFDENTGLVIALADSLTHILKTTDGGESWEIKFSFPPRSSSTSLLFASDQKGVSTGYLYKDGVEQGVVVTTIDGGESWEYQFISESWNMVKVSFTDETTFYSTGQNILDAVVFKSTDAGKTWFNTSFSASDVLLDGINFMRGTESGFVFGSEITGGVIRPVISKTTDSGNNWSDLFYIDEIINKYIVDSKIIDENTVYITGGSITEGIILKSSDASLPVEDERQNIPDKFLLKQNYPNPFNPTTNIEYHIAENSFVTLKVYDILGNELEVIVAEEKQPGVYNVKFTANNKLASGMYFYRLNVSGGTKEFVSTKKMLLVK